MKANNIEYSSNIIPEEKLKTVAGGAGTSDTKYQIHDVFTYGSNKKQRHVIVGIGEVDVTGDRKYIVDFQEYTLIRTDDRHDFIMAAGEGPSIIGSSYSWVSLGLSEVFESFIDQFYTKIGTL